LELLLGGLAVFRRLVEVAVNELDRLEHASRGFAFPNFAEASATEAVDQAIAGDRLNVGSEFRSQGRLPTTKGRPGPGRPVSRLPMGVLPNLSLPGGEKQMARRQYAHYTACATVTRIFTMPEVRYALSLKQPWATLLVHGLKSIEVRRWSTPRL